MKFKDDDCSKGFPCGDPGTYECEVKDVKERVTSKSDEMWSLEFKDINTGKTICFDNLVFSEKACGFAYAKIKQLGITRNDAGEYDFERDDLIGKRASLTLVVEEDEKYGDKLVPKFGAENFGYKAVEADLPF